MRPTLTLRLSGPVLGAVAQVDITDLVSLETRGGRHRGAPARPGRLTGRVLMLADATHELLLVVLDLLELYEPWLDRFKAVLTRFTDVPPANIAVWCNHIHAASSSDGVAEWPIADRLAEAILKARADYTPVEMAHAAADLGPGWTINRRFAIGDLDTFCVMFNDDCKVDGDRLEVSGQVRAHLRTHGIDPTIGISPDATAYCQSPADTRLELLSLRRQDNTRPLAAWIRFPAHPAMASATKIGNALHPDFIGTLRERFESDFGGTVFFAQGPCGDVRPLHQDYGIAEAEKFGRRLAGEAANLVGSLRYKQLVQCAAATERANLSLRPEYAWPADALAAERARVDAQIEAAGDPRDRLRLIRRRQVLRWVHFHEHDRPTIIPPHARQSLIWPIEVKALRFNGHLLVGLPGEIFAETGAALRTRIEQERLAEAATVTELCGAYANYVSPASQYGTGGYEDTCCFLRDGSAEQLIDVAVGAARLLFPADK